DIQIPRISIVMIAITHTAPAIRPGESMLPCKAIPPARRIAAGMPAERFERFPRNAVRTCIARSGKLSGAAFSPNVSGSPIRNRGNCLRSGTNAHLCGYDLGVAPLQIDPTTSLFNNLTYLALGKGLLGAQLLAALMTDLIRQGRCLRQLLGSLQV